MQQSSKPPEIDLSNFQQKELIAQTHDGNITIKRISDTLNEFVLKSILRSSIETEQQLQHLFNERSALWQFNHQNINKLVGTAKDQKHLHFILQLVEGITLNKLIQMNQKLRLEYATLIIIQLLQALKYIHNEGYVYRDLKASNVIIDQFGKVTLIDFGYCKQIEKERTYTICGTTHSMAPEIFSNKGYSYEVDYYAIGILFFELLDGLPPFGLRGDDLEQKINKGIQADQLKKIENQQAANLILQLLNIEPKNRLGSQGGVDQILKHDFLKRFDVDEISNIWLKSQEVQIKYYVDVYADDISKNEFIQLYVSCIWTKKRIKQRWQDQRKSKRYF